MSIFQRIFMSSKKRTYQKLKSRRFNKGTWSTGTIQNSMFKHQLSQRARSVRRGRANIDALR